MSGDIAILGAGNVGQALAERLLAAGASVRLGVRDPDAARAALPPPLSAVPVGLPRAAAAGVEAIVVAVPAAAAEAAVRACGDVRGVVVDATNPLRWDNGPVWAPPPAGSQAAALAAAFPGARVVKGFNHFGAEVQRHPRLDAGPADAFFAGDDAAAKALVLALAERMGFRPRDAGPLRNAALLENLAVLWIHLATTEGGRDFGFRTAPLA